MGGGFPFARFAAALVLSLSAHLLLAWGFTALSGASPGEGGGVEPIAQSRPASRPAATRYLPASALDTRPQVMTRVMPRYPAELISGLRGRVVLELYISADGVLDRIQVAKADPPGRFEQSALEAFRAARYAPGRKGGVPVPSLMRIEVTFGD